MANSTLLGGEHSPQQPVSKRTGALGPSDSSDSGSDVQGGADMNEALLGSDTDAAGTGERGAAGELARDSEPVDIAPDRIGSMQPPNRRARQDEVSAPQDLQSTDPRSIDDLAAQADRTEAVDTEKDLDGTGREEGERPLTD